MNSKKYPTIGACGIDCCLCPMHHVSGGGGCPGCTAPVLSGASGRWCAIARCAVRERSYETCADCPDLSCERLAGLDESDSFVTHRKTLENLRFIMESGINSFLLQQERREVILRRMLAGFDDGRSKSYFCLACILLPIEELEMTLVDADEAAMPVEDRKGRARILRQKINNAAERLGIELKLRR